MVEEARLETTEGGTAPVSEGWFTLHVSEAAWMGTSRFGKGVRFEGAHRFPEIGFNIRYLEPGTPACLYHREGAQEDFLVLAGECVLVIEEQERRLRAGHFVHCPAGTNHVFVGDGDGPCVILMVGSRPDDDERLCYPVSAAAAEYGASVERETSDQQAAYGPIQIESVPAIWPLYGVE